MLKSSDIRISALRDASVHWRARGEAVHIPTGATVEFEESWNDRSGRTAALLELERRVLGEDFLI